MKRIGRNDKCWCGRGRKYKNCHADFDNILAQYRAKGAITPPRSIIKNESQIQGIRESAKWAAIAS